jgi:hypothetical protein
MAEAETKFTDIFANQPTYVNYGRVVLDIIMTVCICSIAAYEISAGASHDTKSIHVNQVPIYKKTSMITGDLWKQSIDDQRDKTTEERVDWFRESVKAECETIPLHPLCVCIAGVGSDAVAAKNCMLQHPQPSVTSDWFVGTVTSAMIIWFMASLATSVGTLPFISSYITFRQESNQQNTVIQYKRVLVITYGLAVAAMIVVPLVVTAVSFPDKHAKHLQCICVILSTGCTAFVVMGLYNYQTVSRYVFFTEVEESEAKATESPQVDDNGNPITGAPPIITPPPDTATLMSFQQNSITNFILYVHLLVSAPAIAMILHLTQQWTELNTIINTTCVISTIFAVDAFSAELSNFWSHHTTSIHLKKKFGPHDKEIDQQIQDSHTKLGMIRMFAWVINLAMLLLLFSLAYPIEVEQQKTNSAIFVVIVVAYGAMFLAPDLVREFTDRVSFNSIQFRLYGDFVVRAMALFFVWRASAVDRT